MNSETESRWFFVHVQKTGGVSLQSHIQANYHSDEIYPPMTAGIRNRYSRCLDAREFLQLPLTSRNSFRMVQGHYPFVSALRSGGGRKVITILRDPVDRAVSVLRMTKKSHAKYRDWSLLQIYEDAGVFGRLIKDHQVKVFGIVEADKTDSVLHEIDMNPIRLEVAKQRLRQVDVLGFQDDFDSLLDTLRDGHGWRLADRRTRLNVGTGPSADASLRNRIEAENPYDQQFWAFARALARR